MVNDLLGKKSPFFTHKEKTSPWLQSLVIFILFLPFIFINFIIPFTLTIIRRLIHDKFQPFKKIDELQIKASQEASQMMNINFGEIVLPPILTGQEDKQMAACSPANNAMWLNKFHPIPMVIEGDIDCGEVPRLGNIPVGWSSSSVSAASRTINPEVPMSVCKLASAVLQERAGEHAPPIHCPESWKGCQTLGIFWMAVWSPNLYPVHLNHLLGNNFQWFKWPCWGLHRVIL